MVLLADIGGISGVVSTLNSIKVPPDVINDIVSILDTSTGELAPNQLQPVNGAWFGSAWSSQNLGIHTDKAHEKIQNALIEAVAAIAGTGDAMVQFEKELGDTDADAAAVSQTLVVRTEQAVNQMDGDRHTPPAQVPTNTDGGDQ